ncbi:MAG: hypothetical protein ABI476_03220 [Oxalobacteraceae bacterium]
MMPVVGHFNGGLLFQLPFGFTDKFNAIESPCMVTLGDAILMLMRFLPSIRARHSSGYALRDQTCGIWKSLPCRMHLPT